MEIKQYTKNEMEQIEQEEKGMPVRKRWYKHKEKDIYQYQLDMLEINNFEEV